MVMMMLPSPQVQAEIMALVINCQKLWANELK